MTKVAAAIIKKNNKILICQRSENTFCPLLWEFPGGKLEKNESLEECLIRECEEELNVTIKVNEKFMETTYTYPERKIDFTFYICEIVNGKEKNIVHKNIKWVTPEEMKEFTFAPADVPIVDKLLGVTPS